MGEVFDWKKETERILNIGWTISPSNWHFQFKPCKRFIFRKSKDTVLIRGETLYRSDMGHAKGVCKRGLKIIGRKPKELHVYCLTIMARVTVYIQHCSILFNFLNVIKKSTIDENSEPEDVAGAVCN
ncbi:hypothetical protein QE152_g11173 [Popillia japonica]|uniref:Uncharacterized protein n=1 Tax=Popillia japonica TaxID=7064 RepID=A0AAW1LRE4_POPJA